MIEGAEQSAGGKAEVKSKLFFMTCARRPPPLPASRWLLWSSPQLSLRKMSTLPQCVYHPGHASLSDHKPPAYQYGHSVYQAIRPTHAGLEICIKLSLNSLPRVPRRSLPFQWSGSSKKCMTEISPTIQFACGSVPPCARKSNRDWFLKSIWAGQRNKTLFVRAPGPTDYRWAPRGFLIEFLRRWDLDMDPVKTWEIFGKFAHCHVFADHLTRERGLYVRRLEVEVLGYKAEMTFYFRNIIFIQERGNSKSFLNMWQMEFIYKHIEGS